MHAYTIEYTYVLVECTYRNIFNGDQYINTFARFDQHVQFHDVFQSSLVIIPL